MVVLEETKDSQNEKAFAMVPCHLMKGIVHVRDPSSLSTLHLLTLKAISKHGELKDVLHAFGVGQRMMQNVLTDLFYDGLIFLNLRDGKVVPSPQVTEAVRKNNLEELLAIRAPREVEVTWVQERISGGVMSYQSILKYLSRPEISSGAFNLAPKPIRMTPLKDLSTRSLARAAAPILQEKAPGGGSVVDRVERIENRRMVGSRTFYVPVTILRPSPSEEPALIPEIRGVPQSIVDAWTAAMNPTKEFAELALVAKPPTDPLMDLTPEGMAKEWESHLDALSEYLQSGRSGAYDLERMSEIIGDIERLSDRLNTSIHGADDVRVLGGRPAEHYELVAELLGQTKELAIIGSAFLKPENLVSISKPICEALKRGARIVLLWGLPQANEGQNEKFVLEDAKREVKHCSEDLEEKLASNLWILPSTAPFHSKFVAVDGKQAVVSSMNFLSTPISSGAWEASAMVSGGTIPREIMSYGLERIPREVLIGGMACEDLMSDTISRVQVPSTSGAWFKASQNLRIELEAYNNRMDSISKSALLKTVKNASKLSDSIRSGTSTVQVRDAEHRRLLTSAIDNARKEVIVTSDRVRDEAVGRNFEKVVSEAAARGTRVIMRWGRETAEDVLDHDYWDSKSKAERFKENVGDSLDINLQPCGIHAKTVILDESLAIVSSYNFLAFGGVTGAERTLSGELGIVICNPEIAKALKDSLMKHLQLVSEKKRGR